MIADTNLGLSFFADFKILLNRLHSKPVYPEFSLKSSSLNLQQARAEPPTPNKTVELTASGERGRVLRISLTWLLIFLISDLVGMISST